MTVAPAVLARALPEGAFRPKLRLGFDTRVSFNAEDGPERGLRDGIAPCQAAERLG